MSSFGDSMTSKGISTKLRKSLSFKVKGKPKDGSFLLSDTVECASSLSSSSGNHSNPNRRSLPESEKETTGKISMSMKKFRKSFSAGLKLHNKTDENSSGETNDRSSHHGKEVLDVRRQSLLERQDQLIGEVLPEIKEKRRSKNKARTSSLDAANSSMDDDSTPPSELSSSRNNKKKKARKSTLEISHDEYGDIEQRPAALGKVSNTKCKQKKKKARKSTMAVSDRLEDVEAGKIDQVEGSGDKRIKKKKKMLLSKIADDAVAEGVDSNPNGTQKEKPKLKRKKPKLKKKKPKRKSEFTASLLDDLTLELGSIGSLAEAAARTKAENEDNRTMDVSGSAPVMNHDMDPVDGPTDESCAGNELIETPIEEERNQPKAQSPSDKLETTGNENEADSTMISGNSASRTVAVTAGEEEEHRPTTQEEGPDPSEEVSPEKADRDQESEKLNRDASLDDEEANSATEGRPSFTRGSILMSETNAYAMSLMYGTSSDSDDDGDSTNIDEDMRHKEAKFEDAVTVLDPAGSQASNGSCDQAASDIATDLDASSTVYEVASDSGSGFSDTEIDAEQEEESQVQIVPTVEERGRESDSDSEDVNESQEVIQVELVPIVEELEEDSDSEFSARDSDEGHEAAPAALRKQIEQLQGLLHQQELETEMLEESVAIHKSNAIEQNDQIKMYKGMVEDLQEDYDMVLRTYHDQVEQNELLLGHIGKMKHGGLKHESLLRQKSDRIEGLEQQLSVLQQSQDVQILLELKDENERLRKMVDLQKKSLFQMIMDTKVLQC